LLPLGALCASLKPFSLTVSVLVTVRQSNIRDHECQTRSTFGLFGRRGQFTISGNMTSGAQSATEAPAPNRITGWCLRLRQKAVQAVYQSLRYPPSQSVAQASGSPWNKV